MARLILSLGGKVMAEYNMNKERYTIGRLPDSDVHIDNPAVSEHHSLIINKLNDSFLEDLNSTNGTYVNEKMFKKHALQHDDIIAVGHHQIRFIEGGAPEESAEDEFACTIIIDNSQAAIGKQIAADVRQIDAIRADATETAKVNKTPVPTPLPIGKVRVLNGSFAGREVDLNKTLTTLGQPGVQVIAITRRKDGFFIVPVENEKGDPAKVNGEPLSHKARKLSDNDVVELMGIKMGFFIA